MVHVRYLHPDGSDGGPDSTEARFVDNVPVPPGEPVVTKHDRSAFDGTDLDGILRRAGVRRLVLAGVVTEGGIETTARSALAGGYQVTVLSDAVAGVTPDSHAAALSRLTDAGVDVVRLSG